MMVLALKLFVVFALAMVAAFYLTPPVAKLLVHFGVVDKPSKRRINTKPIPRGGGIALVLAFFISVSIAYWGMWPDGPAVLSRDDRHVVLLASGLLIAVGLLDDVFGLKPFLKLLGQLIVAALLYSTGLCVGLILPFDVPCWLDCLLTLGWFALIINAFNLIDGLDGLASGLAFIGALGLSICLLIRGKPIAAMPLFALMGACLGFLRYNFNPASVFLGDTGSMFLGFVLALVPLVAGGKAALLASIGVPLLVIGVPLFDTVLAVWRRSIKAQLSPDGGLSQVFLPDMEHLHHRFLSSGISQRGVACTLYVIAAVMVLMAVGITVFSDRSTGVILVGAVIVFGIMSRQLSRVELWYTGTALRKSFHSKAKRLLVPAYVVCDILVSFAAWWGSADLAMIPHIKFRGLWYLSVFPVFFAAIFGMMWAFQIYHRMWSKSQVRDYIALVTAVFTGWVVAYAIVTLAFSRYPGFWRHATVFLLLVMPLSLVLRAVRVSINSMLSVSEDNRIVDKKNSRRIIVYGAGERFSMFDLQRTGSLLGRRNFNIVGVIDDDPLKFRRLVHGYKIAGGIEEVEKLAHSSNANAILIAADLPGERMEKLLAVAREWKIEILRFDHSLTKLFDPAVGEVREVVGYSSGE